MWGLIKYNDIVKHLVPITSTGKNTVNSSYYKELLLTKSRLFYSVDAYLLDQYEIIFLHHHPSSP